MSDSVSKYFEKLEDEEHWKKIEEEKRLKAEQSSLLNKVFSYFINLIKKKNGTK